MNALWQCAVCETVNNGGRSCTACGAAMTRRSAAVTAVRSRIAQAPPPPPAAAPLPEPVRRAINREPVDEDGMALRREQPHHDAVAGRLLVHRQTPPTRSLTGGTGGRGLTCGGARPQPVQTELEGEPRLPALPRHPLRRSPSRPTRWS